MEIIQCTKNYIALYISQKINLAYARGMNGSYTIPLPSMNKLYQIETGSFFNFAVLKPFKIFILIYFKFHISQQHKID
jgi:hypothetical protein